MTGLLAVPLHRRLDDAWDDAWDAAVHRRLPRVDTVRALAATAGTGAAVWLVLGG